eukprot:scaffold71303_cov34-Prasinocladus_malaysianus.AAC.1
MGCSSAKPRCSRPELAPASSDRLKMEGCLCDKGFQRLARARQFPSPPGLMPSWSRRQQLESSRTFWKICAFKLPNAVSLQIRMAQIALQSPIKLTLISCNSLNAQTHAFDAEHSFPDRVLSHDSYHVGGCELIKH